MQEHFASRDGKPCIPHAALFSGIQVMIIALPCTSLNATMLPRKAWDTKRFYADLFGYSKAFRRAIVRCTTLPPEFGGVMLGRVPL
jgi:hypothetical protein